MSCFGWPVIGMSQPFVMTNFFISNVSAEMQCGKATGLYFMRDQNSGFTTLQRFAIQGLST